MKKITFLAMSICTMTLLFSCKGKEEKSNVPTEQVTEENQVTTNEQSELDKAIEELEEVGEDIEKKTEELENLINEI